MTKKLILIPGLVLALSCGDDGNGSTTNAESNDSSSADGSSGTGTPMRDPCAENAETMADCVEQARYVADLTALTSGSRAAGDPGHAAAQDLGFDRLTELGFETQRQEYSTGTNIIGRRVGTTRPEEVVVVAAHYDSVPNCPGADDNASGTAGVLEAARVLAKFDFERTLVIGLWDQEEVDFSGVQTYVDGALAQGDTIVGNYNFEMIAFFDDAEDSQVIPEGLDSVWPEQAADIAGNGNRGDFITIVADEHAREMSESLVLHAERIGLRTIWVELLEGWISSPLFSDLRRSDHSVFWDAGLPAIMITDTSEFRNDNYHCRGGLTDSIETLDHGFATQVIQMTVGSASEFLGGI